MRKLSLTVALAFLTVSIALAQNVHLVGQLRVNDVGTQLLVRGKIAGLGQGDVTLIVDAVGVASVECRNPGGNIAPGQDTEVTTSGSVTLPSPKNGNLNFSLLTDEPSVGSEACPNPQWTAEVTDVTFSGGTFTVVQGGQIVLQQAF